MLRRTFLISQKYLRIPSLSYCSSVSNNSFDKKSIGELLNNPDLIEKKVNVSGWVIGSRLQKDNVFLDLTDGLNGRLQIVLNKENLNNESIDHVTFHSCVNISGVLSKSTHPAQKVELLASKVPTILNNIEIPEKYPFNKKAYNLDHVRKFPHFRCKTQSFGAFLRIRNSLTHSIHSYFQENGFIQIQVPILTGNDCEGAGEVFEVSTNQILDESNSEENDQDDIDNENPDDQKHYFKKRVYLTVSGQLHLEAACNGIAKVYSFSPTFRAEPGVSLRHLSEFSMIEGEIAFSNHIEDVTNFVSSLLKSSASQTLEKCSNDISLYKRLTKEDNLSDVQKMIDTEFIVLTYDEVFKILDKKRKKFTNPPVYGQNLSREQELFLVEKHCKNVPCYIVEWPRKSKPFYCRSGSSDDKVQAFDLIFPKVGELVGGSLREYQAEKLEKSIKDAGLNPQSLEWYVNLRRCGSSPSGGFGIGFERYLQYLLGIANIKDTLAFPRNPKFCPL